jgi:EmrB/QacA subfamily drug resistance transporter
MAKENGVATSIDLSKTTRSLTEPNRWLLPVILLGNAFNIFDTFVVNVALPTLSRTLHASSAALEWVVGGYIVGYVCLLVIGGRLGDMFGRRRMFLLGMTGFVLASTVCGLAPDATVLIAGRIVQGATGALMVPQTLAMIQVLYQGEARQRALGLFGMANSVAMVVGQVLGGLLISVNIGGLSWRVAFLINIPVGVAGLLASRKIIPENRASQVTAIDGTGAMLLTGALVLLLVPLTVGRDQRWPAWCWILLLLVPLVAWIFVIVERRIERRGRTPLLPLTLLSSAGMRRGLVVGFAVFASFGGLLLTTTVSLQDGLNFSPVKAGLMISPYAVTFMAGSLLSRRAAARFGRMALFGGGVLNTLSCVGLALLAHVDYSSMPPIIIASLLGILGFGQGILMIPLLGIILAEVPSGLTGAASGVWSTTKETAIAFGVAVVGALFFALAADHGFGTATVAAATAEAVLAAIAAVGALTLPMRRP